MSSTETVPTATDRAERPPIQVIAPATGELLATVPNLSAVDVEAAVDRARAAQPGWEALGFDGRGAVLRRAQRWITDHADEVLDTIVAETGKAREDAQIAELAYGAAALGFWAKRAPKYLADEKVRSTNRFLTGKQLRLRHRPIGVVGVIGPWNFPLTNSFGDVIPALAAGNSVVLKPSEVTPLTSQLMARMLRECGLPEDVFQVVTGDGETGAALVDHVDFLQFTGSTKTGKAVMKRAAETVTPIGLELGGKDPMVVLADADLERAANGAAYYSMLNGGQICISVERVYVEDPVYDDFVARVAHKVAALRQGVPGAPGSVDIGAVTFEPQLELLERHVRDAVDKGARVVTGGRRGEGPGRFFEPTVLADVDHTMDVMREETFGPIVPIMRVRDAEEGLRMANDSPYGLQGSVWTRSVKRGRQLARRMQVGGVSVNDAVLIYTALEVPMGGVKRSGIGQRHGQAGIRKYTVPQGMMVVPFGLKRELNMYPYRSWSSGLLARMIRMLNRGLPYR
ncbi:succinic semialdehyde dehydrogenase [Conexibacter sp. SYSU D00693]|uniref:succinic semialdehyde dehydrogenase n=1 Tax=Conexibacter sp. SYSU D00693 TaxID=2812560 RepID=UPI00196ABED0|nr:succinic semialdehyde dehydrogenase [Conexibacter sp. SYSU D00693]